MLFSSHMYVFTRLHVSSSWRTRHVPCISHVGHFHFSSFDSFQWETNKSTCPETSDIVCVMDLIMTCSQQSPVWHLPPNLEVFVIFILFIIMEKSRSKERTWDGAGVMKDKELKFKDVKVPHTLGWVSYKLLVKFLDIDSVEEVVNLFEVEL